MKGIKKCEEKQDMKEYRMKEGLTHKACKKENRTCNRKKIQEKSYKACRR
jgi:hypothetical protein